MAVLEIESNPCIRCGKERIKSKEQVIMINLSKTKITVYVCPDKECQKIVDQKIAEREERKAFLLNRSRERANNRHTAKKPS